MAQQVLGTEGFKGFAIGTNVARNHFILPGPIDCLNQTISYNKRWLFGLCLPYQSRLCRFAPAVLCHVFVAEFSARGFVAL